MYKLKHKANQVWRECTVCWQFKSWKLYSKMKTWYNWFTSNCKECRNKKHQAIRSKPWYRDKEISYKREYNHSERWRQINTSYYLYKKNMQNNIEILKKIWEYKPRAYRRIKETKKDIICRLGLESKFTCLLTQEDIYARHKTDFTY